MANIMVVFEESASDRPQNARDLERAMELILEGENARRGRQRFEPLGLRCHVMTNVWVLRLENLSAEDVARTLQEFLPDAPATVVAVIPDDWIALNGALSMSRCFP
jgi:hypothetical protein